MSKIGKIAKCSGCRQEKPIFSELDDSRGDKLVYCENCVKYNHEKIKCERCGQVLLHQELQIIFLNIIARYSTKYFMKVALGVTSCISSTLIVFRQVERKLFFIVCK